MKRIIFKLGLPFCFFLICLYYPKETTYRWEHNAFAASGGALTIINLCPSCSSMQVVITIPATQQTSSYEVEIILGDYPRGDHFSIPHEGIYLFNAYCLSGITHDWYRSLFLDPDEYGYEVPFYCSSTTTSSIPSGSCPSETIYGSDSYEVELLRSIRDNVLSKTQEGQELIKLYYQWSPFIVRAMEADDDFREDIKEMVDGMLSVIE